MKNSPTGSGEGASHEPESYVVPIAEWQRLVSSERIHREQLARVASALRAIGEERVESGHAEHPDCWPHDCPHGACPDYAVLAPYLKPTAYTGARFPYSSEAKP